MAENWFKDSNSFCIHLEKLKKELELPTYIETITWFVENETDLEVEQVVRHLNKKVIDSIKYEAYSMNMLKEKTELVSLFDD